MAELKPIIEQSMTQYAGAVLQSRALVDVRDCLKPSARQIFFCMDKYKYTANKPNLPDDFVEVIIEGGCHAYFGMYGAQDEDGTPTISNQEQINITVENIVTAIG